MVTYEKGGPGVWAARFAYTLRAYGHQNVFILDGHWNEWNKDGRPVETDDEADGYEYTLQPGLVHGYEDVKGFLANDDRQILDQRGADQIK